MREFWIDHPAVDTNPVGFWRWLAWQYANLFGRLIYKPVDRHHQRMVERALYGETIGDDIPF